MDENNNQNNIVNGGVPFQPQQPIQQPVLPVEEVQSILIQQPEQNEVPSQNNIPDTVEAMYSNDIEQLDEVVPQNQQDESSRDMFSQDLLAQQPLMAALMGNPSEQEVMQPANVVAENSLLPKEEEVPIQTDQDVGVQNEIANSQLVANGTLDIEEASTFNQSNIDDGQTIAINVQPEFNNFNYKPVKKHNFLKYIGTLLLLVLLGVGGYFGYQYYDLYKEVEKITSYNEAYDYFDKTYGIKLEESKEEDSYEKSFKGSNKGINIELKTTDDEKIWWIKFEDSKNGYKNFLKYYKPFALSKDEYEFFEEWVLYAKKYGTFGYSQLLSFGYAISEEDGKKVVAFTDINGEKRESMAKAVCRYDKKNSIICDIEGVKRKINIFDSINEEKLDGLLYFDASEAPDLYFTYGDHAFIGAMFSHMDSDSLELIKQKYEVEAEREFAGKNGFYLESNEKNVYNFVFLIPWENDTITEEDSIALMYGVTFDYSKSENPELSFKDAKKIAEDIFKDAVK